MCEVEISGVSLKILKTWWIEEQSGKTIYLERHSIGEH
jgi:hypothetical protein